MSGRTVLRRELEAAAQLAAIVESSNDAIIGTTVDGVITTWNAGSERMYGYSRADAIGHHVSMIMPPDRLPEAMEVRRQVIAGQPGHPVDTRRLRSDGSLVDVAVTVSPIRDGSGALIGLSSVARDLTESHRQVEALRAGEARKSAILASAPDAVVTMDHNGRICEFNPAAERTFGHAARDVIGRDLAETIVPPDQRAAHTRGLLRHLTNGGGAMLGQRNELMAMRADGSLFPAEVSIVEVSGSDPPLFTGFIRDLTDLRAAEASRRALEGQLHQSKRLEALGQLAGGIAHDFNNLLTVIQNLAADIVEAQPGRAGAEVNAVRILSAAERAARLTKQLVMFARREPMQVTALDLNAVVEGVRGLLSSSIGVEVELVVHAAAELPAIWGDRGLVEQILVNLAVNARDAMPDGGVLTVRTMLVELDAARAARHPPALAGPYVELSVSDDGEGMSEDVAVRAVEPYFSTKGQAEGSGLGLAIVAGIASEAGGFLALSSEEGEGTTIRVYLPAGSTRPPCDS